MWADGPPPHCPQRPSLLHGSLYHWCGHQVRSEKWRREASKQFFLFSLICCFLHICPSSLLHEPKMQLPTSDAQTYVNHTLNDKGSFIFIEFYASLNRNWHAFMHFISQFVWIYIGICFLIKFFFWLGRKIPLCIHLHPIYLKMWSHIFFKIFFFIVFEAHVVEAGERLHLFFFLDTDLHWFILLLIPIKKDQLHSPKKTYIING